MKAERVAERKQDRSASVSVNAGFFARWVQVDGKGGGGGVSLQAMMSAPMSHMQASSCVRKGGTAEGWGREERITVQRAAQLGVIAHPKHRLERLQQIAGTDRRR